MNKCLAVVLALIGLTSCANKDNNYYRSHPKELQAAVKACPDQQPKGLTCQQIGKIADRMNRLGYQLQVNPQAFGGKILALQYNIAEQQLHLKKDANNAQLKASLDHNLHELAYLLAVVKWLESPEG